MKYFKFLSVVFVTTLLISSCQDEILELDCENSAVLENYTTLGEWHNDFLTNVKDNFNPDGLYQLSYDEKVDTINTFHKTYVQNLGISQDATVLLRNEFDKLKQLVDKEYTFSILFSETEIIEGKTIFGVVEELKELEIIDDFEVNLVTEMLNLVDSNYNGGISAEGLKTELMNLKNDWNNQGYTECDSSGKFSGIVLSIAIASVDWWIENPEEGIQVRVAPWVAADVGGAIYGAAAGAIGSSVIGEFSWESTGWAALAGAVGASTGIAGKIGKWIFG